MMEESVAKRGRAFEFGNREGGGPRRGGRLGRTGVGRVSAGGGGGVIFFGGVRNSH